MDILTIVFGIFALSFCIAYITTLKKLNIITAGFTNLLNLFSNIESPNELTIKTQEDIHKENFIKFLSDSREWAYGYIEEVQSALKQFIKEVEPEIEYYNKYGIVIEGMIPPHDKALKKIAEEFQELKKLLPEESNDRR